VRGKDGKLMAAKVFDANYMLGDFELVCTITSIFNRKSRKCLGFKETFQGADFVYEKEEIKKTSRNFAVMEYMVYGTLFKFTSDRCTNGRLP
jgi:hypothetical protein